MPCNKSRLQLALYARPKYPGTYHYALFISPKSTRQQIFNSATKFHVKNTLLNNLDGITQPWRYESVDIPDVRSEYRLLVRVIIAKVTVSSNALEDILHAVPIYQTDDVNKAEAQTFTCLTWVRAAVIALGKQGAVTRLKEWEQIKKESLAYVERKLEMGRWSETWKGTPGVPMLDLFDGEEIVE